MEIIVTEFVAVEVLGTNGEVEAHFGQRLTAFWSEILREIPDEFEKVYAETILFETVRGKPSRCYAIESDAVDLFVGKLRQAGFEVPSPSDEDIYTKYELPATEWWQIEH
jgi:hypothetical protein